MPTRPRRFLFAVLAASLPAFILSAATYIPMSDADLAGAAPMIAHARVVSSTVRLESIAGEDRPVTFVTFQLLEAIKGSPGASFVLRLPGGRVGDALWWVPGSPSFTEGEEVVLMLGLSPDRPGQLRLTELGLSKFDLVADETGRRFAVRPAFDAGGDLVVSKRAAVPVDGAPARDAESFLAFLRHVARGQEPPEVLYAAPVAARAKWANIGGGEPGDGCGDTPCLFRWFWGAASQPSPNAVLRVSGTQTNLVDDGAPCGADANCDVQNAATAWHGVAASDVRLSGPEAGGNITVNLDATTSQDGGTAWNTPADCSGGIIGLGGPGNGTGPRTYRGDTTYYAPVGGTVSMRKVICGSGYPASTFRSAVLHEVGHVMGLAHPNQHVSIHSTTTPTDWANAVMYSSISSTHKPDTPQSDDIQAIQYYYGTAAPGPAPSANFTVSASPTVGLPVTFTDASTGGATGWNWDFGEPASSSNTATSQNASHVFSQPQTYSVTLTAGSLNGSNSITKHVTVAANTSPCSGGTGTTTLCLDDSRFETRIAWTKPNGDHGSGNAVSLTGDSGYFWFFDAGNIEAVVKVLNACGLNPPRYWVFAAGLTDVGVLLTVRDTSSGKVQTYTNTVGTPFQPIQDTNAFATCP